MRNFAPGKSAIALVRKEADTTGWLCPLPADAAHLVPGKVPELPVQFLGLELHLKADKNSLQCSGGTMNLYEACKVCFKSWSLPIY
jgi:hypothetical protein